MERNITRKTVQRPAHTRWVSVDHDIYHSPCLSPERVATCSPTPTRRDALFFYTKNTIVLYFFFRYSAFTLVCVCRVTAGQRPLARGLRLAFRCEPDLGPILPAVLAHPATGRSPACAAARASLRRRVGAPGIWGTSGLRRVRAVPSADCNELFNAGCRMETPQQGRPSKSAVTDFSRRSVAPRSQEPGLAHRCAGVDKECALVVPDYRTRLRVRLPTGCEPLLSMLHARAGDAIL